jgi:hypothetical protein
VAENILCGASRQRVGRGVNPGRHRSADQDSAGLAAPGRQKSTDVSPSLPKSTRSADPPLKRSACLNRVHGRAGTRSAPPELLHSNEE